MFFRNEDVTLTGNALFDALGKYRASPAIFSQLEACICRALRSLKELANAERLPTVEADCSSQLIDDMLVLDIRPVFTRPTKFLPNEGIRATIRMKVANAAIIRIQEMVVQMNTLG